MATREPVMLIVLIETGEFRWYAAGVDRNSEVTPLVRSPSNDLSPYVAQPYDEQVSFLRHRLSGVLQRGCDRLFGRGQKPAHIVFAVDGLFLEAVPELTQRVADHFVQWMTNPPVVFLVLGQSRADKRVIAGDWPAAERAAFEKAWPALAAAQSQQDLWELIETRR